MTTVPVVDIHSIAPSAIIELFVLDTTPTPIPGGGIIFYFHAGTNGLHTNIVWQGVTYHAMPIMAEGFQWNSKGTLPRPKLSVSALDGTIGAAMHAYYDLIGAMVTRKQTFAKYLDAVNFPGNYNPTANPTIAMQDDPWYIERKLLETKDVIQWELITPIDAQNAKIPMRRIIADVCTSQYKGIECGWTPSSGHYYDATDTACSAGADVCSKKLSGCKVRFGALNDLSFGGFPGTAHR